MWTVGSLPESVLSDFILIVLLVSGPLNLLHSAVMRTCLRAGRDGRSWRLQVTTAQTYHQQSELRRTDQYRPNVTLPGPLPETQLRHHTHTHTHTHTHMTLLTTIH